MSFFCIRSICVFLVSLVGFFPYMPLVHATPLAEASPVHHCSSHHDESSDHTGHDMNLCLDIIQQISSSQISRESDSYEPTFILPYIFPYWEGDTVLEKKSVQKMPLHALDPPYFTSHSLVGIVKLTN